MCLYLFHTPQSHRRKEWKDGQDIDGGDGIIVKYDDNVFRLSWKAFIVFHSVVHMKSAKNTEKRASKTLLTFSVQHPRPRPAAIAQLSEMSVSESYRTGRTQASWQLCDTSCFFSPAVSLTETRGRSIQSPQFLTPPCKCPEQPVGVGSATIRTWSLTGFPSTNS